MRSRCGSSPGPSGPQIFHEAWRINRDYFYATNMHGADWNAMRHEVRRAASPPGHRGDLNRVIRMMLSELAVGHSFLGGGERLYEPKPIPVGLLGADYEVADGRFRFKTIYGGAYWDPSLRAPLTAPGVDVKPGDFLLAVDGKEIKADSEVYRAFRGQRPASGSSSRSAPRPTAPAPARSWSSRSPTRARCATAPGSRATSSKVHERTKGRVAYVYVPNTAGAGYEYFKRYFFPQADKDAIIVDERFNGGGQVADYYIDLLAPAAGQLLGDAVRRADPHAECRDPRAQGDDHRRDGRAPAATCCPGCSASSAWASWSASGPGAAWSASWASRS